MGNAARKARKKSGEKFQHPVKEGTPLEARAIRPTGIETQMRTSRTASARHRAQIQRQIAARDAGKVEQ